MKQYTFKLKKESKERKRVIAARTYLQAILVLQPMILNGFTIEEYKVEPITHKYTVRVEDIEPSHHVINFTREYEFYKTRKLSKEEQHNLIYDIDLEVDAPSYMGEDFEVVSFEIYEEELWQGMSYYSRSN